MLRLRIVAVTMAGLLHLAERFVLPGLRKLWQVRLRLAALAVMLAVAGVVTVCAMHAFVLRPNEELRASSPTFFDISASLFETFQGEDSVRAALHDIAQDAPNGWTRRNITRWAEAHDDPSLRSLVRDTSL